MALDTVMLRPLRAAVLYTKGKALGGTARDDEMIMDAFRAKGMHAESVDLAELRQQADGSFLLRGKPWTAPDTVLMYHGALSPANTGPMLDALEGAGAHVINGHDAWRTMTDKALFFHQMHDAGVPTIPTTEVTSHADGVAALHRFGTPTVFKKPISTEGDDVYIVRSEQQLRHDVTGRLHELDGRVIAQPFVESRIGADLEPAIMRRITAAVAKMAPAQRAALPADFPLGMRNDFRVMTVLGADGQAHIVATFHRIAQSGAQEVNNVAKGSMAVRVEFADLHPADQATLLAAMHAMPQGRIVGWDLIGQPGRRVIMEANSGPGLPTMSEGFIPAQILEPYADLAHAGALQARSAAALRSGAAASTRA